MSELKKLGLIVGVFLAAYFTPFHNENVSASILEAFHMLQEYAREHVLLCLIPAFFIAGAIANFIHQGAVMRYLGSGAKVWLSYLIASISGVVLAVCSCTVLPLFAGIYKRGAGIGPAVAFLYAGPGINLLAIILTARILGWELGVARALGAIVFSVLIGVLMALFFGKEEAKNKKEMPVTEEEGRTPLQNGLFFLTLVLILVFAAWGKPEETGGLWHLIFASKAFITLGLLVVLGLILRSWFTKEDLTSWVATTWDFSKLILPLLFFGVLIAGFLMGRPESDAGLIPAEYVASLVGGNSLRANFVAAFLGAFMYFATLTEVPILQGLLGAGMGQGPALSLLLAGPALSLPNILVIHSVLGLKKTGAFVGLVVFLSTFAGYVFGALLG